MQSYTRLIFLIFNLCETDHGNMK